MAACHDNLARVLQLLAAGTGVPGAARDELFDAAQATGRSRAEQTMPLDDRPCAVLVGTGRWPSAPRGVDDVQGGAVRVYGGEGGDQHR